MKKNKILLLLTLLSLPLTSCSIFDQGSNSINETTSSEVGSSSSEGTIKEKRSIKNPNFDTRIISSIDDVTYEDLFNLGNTVSISIDISKTELDKLASDENTGYKTEVYRRADRVTISLVNNGQKFTWSFDNVGIRQKGNTSRNDIYNDKGHLNYNHFKLSFDETFTDPELYDADYIATYGNLEYADRDFLGISGYDVKWNKCLDASYLREIYSSYLYRASGVIAQHIGLTTMKINQEDGYVNDFGLCTLFESASKSLIKRSLKDEGGFINMPTWKQENKGTYGVPDAKYGDYYKASWGVGEGASNSGADMTLNSIAGSRIGIKNNSGTYIPTYERKTNTDATYNDDLLRTAITLFNKGTYNDISNVVDLEYLAVEEAVSYFVGNPDSLRNNYNNYQFYFRRTDGKMVIIPIDNDRYWGITNGYNPRGNGLKDIGPYDDKDSSNNKLRNPLLTKTILTNGTECNSLYTEFIKTILDSSWVNVETFNAYENKIKASYPTINVSSEEDKHNFTFENYINAKLVTTKKALGMKVENNTNDNEDEVNLNVSISDVNRLELRGSFNSWGGNDEQCHFVKKDGDIYEASLTVYSTKNKVVNGTNISTFEIKIGTYPNEWKPNDYSIDFANNKLIENKGNSIFPEAVKIGDKIVFRLNVETNEITYTINK